MLAGAIAVLIVVGLIALFLPVQSESITFSKDGEGKTMTNKTVKRWRFGHKESELSIEEVVDPKKKI